MLGDQIAEESGSITGFRVVDAVGPKVEVSIQTKGKILGNDYQGRATYTSEVQPDGFLFGEGQGIYMAAAGDGMAVWKGQGSGRFNPGGGVSYRGSLHFVRATGKLAKLAGMAAAFEYNTDANDKTSAKLWEWK
jgi:hypothetical protein